MSDVSTDDLSGLCTECGLCCTGQMFTYVDLEPDDKVRLQNSDANTNDLPGDRIKLTCRFLQGTACTVYEHRPQACRDYACRLFLGVKKGEVALDDARDLVAEAIELHHTMMAALPPGKDIVEGREELIRGRMAPDTDPEVFARARVAAMALQLTLDRNFRGKSQAKVMRSEAD